MRCIRSCRRGVATCLFLTAAFFAISGSAAEVLIYYANENAPEGQEASNYETFVGWLREIDTEESRKVADGLNRDSQEFPAAVDVEIDCLRDAVSNHEFPLPVLIFTNRLARRDRCLVLRPGKTSSEEAFEVPDTDDLVVDGNPLCRPEILAAALDCAAELFPPDAHRYVLITKSHGSASCALTVRLQHDAADFSLEELRELLDADDPPTLRLIGTTKSEYFDTLAAAGERHGMQFSLAFIESCRGVFDASDVSRFPENIDLLYASGDRYLQYQTLDYPLIIETTVQTGLVSQAIEDQLREKYLAIYRAERPKSGWVWLWFVPLIILAGLAVAHRLGKHRVVPDESQS